MEFDLRPWRKTDVDSVYRYANNKRIADNLRDVFPFPYVREDAENFVEACIEADGQGQICRAICVEGEAVGSIGVFVGSDVYRRSAEVGYWLAEPFWKKRHHEPSVKADLPRGV